VSGDFYTVVNMHKLILLKNNNGHSTDFVHEQGYT